jgi:phosphoribosylaminoimidazole-succinocarboxamide synthase
MQVLPDTLVDLDLDLPDRRDGKVRISWQLPDDDRGGRRLFVTTDRLSAFDRILATVPDKGAVLNRLAAHWFARTNDIVDNHVISVPDPNVTVARATSPLPVEVVVRGRITGVTDTSIWGMYAAGGRDLYGHHLPEGLVKNDALPKPIVTPTTKAEVGGHDQPVTVGEVADSGLVDRALWGQVVEVALALFERGRELGETAGLVLADTKYEFGIDADGRLLLIDEVHTPDSSRWWSADGLAERLERGEEPESLDKEFVRRLYAEQGFTGHGEPPELDREVWLAVADRYRRVFTMLTGDDLAPVSGSIEGRVKENCREVATW